MVRAWTQEQMQALLRRRRRGALGLGVGLTRRSLRVIEAAPSSLLTDLVLYLKMEEAGANPRLDSTDRGNNFTANNTPGRAAFLLGNGLSLTAASSQYLSLAYNGDFALGASQSFTFACQFKANTGAFATNRYIFTMANPVVAVNSDVPLGIQVRPNAGNPRFSATLAHSDNTIKTVDWSANALVNTTYFGFVWCDAAAGEAGIQVNNGTPVTSSWANGAHTAVTNGIFIGQRGASNFFWDGLIDSVVFARRAWTSEERANYYNGAAGLEYPFS